jgi:glycosyltransferase involved in cell wall biosynthesis
MRQKFCAIYPDHAHKTLVIYNARPLDVFAPIERPFTFELGMLASLHPVKRIYEIVLLVHELRERGYPARLHVAGAKWHGGTLDEYHVSLNRLVQKLNLGEAVTFYDHVADTATWLQNIDVFISNSYWEGHQVALVEAMASGCQCYSHFWDGVEEVLPQENIYATENELAQKLILYSQLADDERLRMRMRMRSIACDMFDMSRQQAGIREVIETALATTV